jgi:hypothetical protein
MFEAELLQFCSGLEFVLTAQTFSDTEEDAMIV